MFCEIETEKLGKRFTKYAKTALVHIKKNKTIYIQLGRYVIYGSLMLATPSFVALASIDTSGYAIYRKVAQIGKWIIIIKGVFDILQSVLNGDTMGAKRMFFLYVLAYAVILALPWALEEVESVFDWESQGGAF